MRKPTDQELFELILQLEDELLEQGMEPKHRAFRLPSKAMRQLGYKSFVVSGSGRSETLDRIRAIHKTLYRRKDIAAGGIHGGAFMFRGIAAAVSIPLIFGNTMINLFEFSDLSPAQINWLQTDAKQVESFTSTCCDLYDFAACLAPFEGYKTPSDRARSLFGLSSFQIQAAAASLCAAFDGRGAIQSAMIGAELALKAALASKGKREEELKSYGHDRHRLVEELGQLFGSFEFKSVRARMQVMPELVPNRYSSHQPSRMETGEIVMASQYLAGAAARAVTGGSVRHKLR